MFTKIVIILYVLKSVYELFHSFLNGRIIEIIRIVYYNKTFIIFYKINNRLSGYSLFEVLLDFLLSFYYLLIKPVTFLQHFLCIIFCLITLCFVPLVFCLIYVSCLIYIIGKIFIKIICKSSCTLSFKNIEISLDWSLCKIILNYIMIPYYYSLIIVYFVIKLKKRKFSWDFIDNLSISSLILKPFWFLKSILLISVSLKSIIFSEMWLRKNIIAWPSIFLNVLKKELIELFRWFYTPVFYLSKGHKIVITDGNLTLNTINCIAEMIITKKLLIDGPSRISFFVCFHQNKAHQIVFIDDNRVGYGFTTPPFIRDSYGSKIPTNTFVTKSNNDCIQRYALIGYGPNFDGILHKGFVKSFYANNMMNEFESYCGFLLKLSIINEIDTTGYMLQQESENKLLSEKLKFNASLIDVTNHFNSYHAMGINPLSKKLHDSKIRHNLEKIESIKNEINKYSNIGFYRLLKESGISYENIYNESFKKNIKEINNLF